MATSTAARKIEEGPYSQLDAIVADVIKANADRNDREGRFPRENLLALAEAGWTGVLNDPRFGGLGLGHVDFAEAAYRIGQADASTGLVYVMHVGAAQTINLFGTDDQKERWLKADNGRLLGTYSTSERATEMSQRIVIGALIIAFLIAEPRGLIALVDRAANVLRRLRSSQT